MSLVHDAIRRRLHDHIRCAIVRVSAVLLLELCGNWRPWSVPGPATEPG